MAEANPSNLSDEDQTKMCDPCSFRGMHTQAGTYCQVCSENLCVSCEAVHQSFKATRDHELKPFADSQRLAIKQKALISSIMVCDIHRTETLTLFCVNHDIAICNVCNTMKHRKCNTQSMKQFPKYANKKNDVFQCIEKIKTLLSDSKEIEQSREGYKQLIENCSRNCIQEVMKFKEQIIACAERQANDMEEKISNAKNQLLAEIESDINAMVEISKQMDHLVSSFEILGQDNEDATFVLMMKETRNIKDGIEMKDDMLKQGKPITLEFQRSDQLMTLLSEITSMGKLKVIEKQVSAHDTSMKQEEQFSFQDISFTTNTNLIDAGTTYVTGCVFMPGGELVICDCNNASVKVYTPDLKLKNDLTIGSRVWDVAVVSQNEVIVTQPDLSSLQSLILSNGIEKSRRISVGISCFGIDCKHERLYICCHERDGQGVVKVLTLDGVTMYTFNSCQVCPYYLAVNNSADRILISAFTNDALCINNTGNTLFSYSDSQLAYSSGLLFDSYNNLIVCGSGTSKVHVVNSDGAKHRIILTEEDGLNSPSCLAYRPSDNTLVVGQYGCQALMAFT